ncbi:MAG: aminoacyl-tRNA hydrolase [Phycisphaeraceae bacterium]|nr:aminoacyl-tRNA hydrolase [Phycisphaeraceae bacterium]
MKLIVGLGNPGPQYEKTRHNAGFMAVDRVRAKWADPSSTPRSRFQGVASEVSISGERCLLLKPTTYMNLSGRSVGEAVGFYKVNPEQDLLVIIDDVSLPAGTIRVRATGGAGGHNGLRDVERALSTQNYPRLRIGIDPCPPMMKLEDYVLGRFSPEQATAVEPALDRAADAVETFVRAGVNEAMNRFNAPDPAPAIARPTPSPGTAKAAPSSTPAPSTIHPGWLGRPDNQR